MEKDTSNNLPTTRDNAQGSNLPATRDNAQGSNLPATRDNAQGSNLPATHGHTQGSNLPLAGPTSSRSSTGAHPFANLNPQPASPTATASPPQRSMGVNLKYQLAGAIFGAVVGAASHYIMEPKTSPQVASDRSPRVTTSAATDEALRKQFSGWTPPTSSQQTVQQRVQSGPEGPGLTMSIIWGLLAGTALGRAAGRFKESANKKQLESIKEATVAQRKAEMDEFGAFKAMYGDEALARSMMSQRYPDTWGAAAARSKPGAPNPN